jgi:ankyrin repeat protein
MKRCALLGDVTILKYFKSVGLDYTILNKNGHSALHKAAIKGKYDACVWLLTPEENGGAGLSKRHMLPDSDGFTPELFATSNGFHELGRFLSEKYLELG